MVNRVESVTSSYHGSKISGSRQSFLTETAICIVERWKKSMGYRFVPQRTHAPESHTSHFFRFFSCHIFRTTASLRSRNFATMATWHDDFSLCLLPPPGKKCKIFLLNPLTIDLRVSGAPFTVTIYSLVDEPGFCNDTIADILLSALEKWCRWTMRIETRLPLFGITISPEIRAK